MKKLVVVLSLMSFGFMSLAQETEQQVNPNSLLGIPKYEHLYKVRVWRNIDLREKQNKGFFARGNEVTQLIIDAVNSGEIADIYEKDSLTKKLSKEEFTAAMVLQQETDAPPAWSPTDEKFQGDLVTYNGKRYEALVDSKGKNPETSKDEWQISNAGKAVSFLASDIYQMQLMEDVIFDKRRSRLYYDMISIKLSAFDTNTGTYKVLGCFRYKDLEKMFRNHPDDAIWFNRQNTAENKNYADAFLLRLFHGVIDKVENPDDERIADIYSRMGRPYKEGVFALEWEEMRLMEKEHNLWEY